MKITVCGGGSLGHVSLGVLSSFADVSVSLLTGKPEQWSNEIVVTDINGRVFNGHISRISSNPAEVITDADIVFFCLPGFAIKSVLQQIKPFVKTNTIVTSIVSSTGFFFAAHEVLGDNAPLAGFQRVPFIARTTEYGHRANLLGYKSSLNMAVENVEDKESLRKFIERVFMTPTTLLANFYEASLTNSNPILHTSRLYSMWHDWTGEPFDRCTLFYKEWDGASAEILIEMDNEFMRLLEKLPVTHGVIPTILNYYESHDAASLAAKLSSIKAFETILSPMKEVEKGRWEPDFKSRYFTEDFPYGLSIIVDLARKNNVSTPCIDRVFEWGMGKVKSKE